MNGISRKKWKNEVHESLPLTTERLNADIERIKKEIEEENKRPDYPLFFVSAAEYDVLFEEAKKKDKLNNEG